MVTNCNQLRLKSPKDGKRDNMSTLELALNMLAEATTTELTKVHNPHGLEENQRIAKKGGNVAGNARREIEQETGKSIITSQNAIQLNEAVTQLIEAFSEIDED